MFIALGVLRTQATKFGNLLSDDFIAIVGRVSAADEHRKRQVTHAERVHAIGMACHHRGSGKAIGHPRS